MSSRFEVTRVIPAEPSAVFAVLCDPQGHVTIDSSGMLMSASGSPVTAVGDGFDVQMSRDALNDLPLGRYEVTVRITEFEPDAAIGWTVESPIVDVPTNHFFGYHLRPVDGGTAVTAWYDWSDVNPVWVDRQIEGVGTVRWPVIPEASIRATLGILERTVVNNA
jgi:hypothetical protein